MFRNVQRLILKATFPSELTELHMNQVGLETLYKNNFYGDTRITQLRIHNSTVYEIKSNTFEDIAVENDPIRKKKSSRIVNESQGGGGLRDYYPGASFFLSGVDRNLHVSITALSVPKSDLAYLS